MAIKADNRPVTDWLTRLKTGQTVLPRFQRHEAWDHSRSTQLFNTILRGLPLGALLVLEIGDEEPFVSRPLTGAPDRGEGVTEHLLDGQQRLTALWRGLRNDYEDRIFFLEMRSDPETGLPYVVDSEPRSRHWALEPIKQWQRSRVPLELCSPGSELHFHRWAQEAMVDRNAHTDLAEKITVVRQKIASFNLPFLALPATTRKEVALDVFIKMNTSGVRLSVFDIVVAQLEEAMGCSLHDLVDDLRKTCGAIEEYYDPEEFVLSASALLQGRAPGTKTYLAKDFGPRLHKNWGRLLEGTERATAFLEQEMVFDAKRLPTDVVVPVLAALCAIAPRDLDGEGRARTILRKYLWRGFFTRRYEATTTARAFNDFNELKALIAGQIISPVVFDDVKYPLPSVPELLMAGWPTKKDRLARAILALALREGGEDLPDGGAVSRANLGRRQYHQLFSEAYLKLRGVPDDRIDVALNCALVTWKIRDREPERYLTERCIGMGVGESEVRARLATHLIPYDELVAGNYQAFLVRRAELVRNAMLNLCSPDLC
jgi:hypothetical protein